MAGNKYIQLYDIQPDVVPTVVAALRGAAPTPNAFHAQYPYALSETDLRSAPSDLTLCEVIESQGDYFLVFCSRRDYQEKEIFEDQAASSITQQVKALQGYETIVALKTQSFQAFDVVAIRPKLKRVELMVDLPQKRSQGFDKHQMAIRLSICTGLILPQLRDTLSLTWQYNLFPAIDTMYRERTGGTLQDIRLRTSTGLIDHLRATDDNDDLRSNKYHVSGAKAINNEVQLFDLRTRFDLTMPDASVTVRLMSSVKALSGLEDSWLGGLEVHESLNQADTLRAINKVVSHLG